MNPRAWVPLAVVGMLLGPVPAPASADGYHVTVGPSFAYSPAQLAIDVGDTVTWTWEGSNHSVTFDEGPDSGVRNVGDESFVHTFAMPGPFHYHCSVHGAMRGTVFVEGAAPSPSPSKSVKPTPTSTPTSASPSPARSTAPASSPQVRPTASTTPPTRASAGATISASATAAPTGSLPPSASESPTPSQATSSPSAEPSVSTGPVSALDDVAAGDDGGLPVLPILLGVLVLGGAGLGWWRRRHA